jgi:hypothetical protein
MYSAVPACNRLNFGAEKRQVVEEQVVPLTKGNVEGSFAGFMLVCVVF